MKTIFENVIKKGGYDLTALLAKVDAYHIEGKLTDAEREELYALARTAPNAQYDLKVEIEHLWTAVRELQNGEKPSDEIKEWKQPTGAHDAYMIGDKVIYTDGNIYKSLIDNNVWSPDVYPNGWEIVL
jgi:hypothetical protein